MSEEFCCINTFSQIQKLKSCLGPVISQPSLRFCIQTIQKKCFTNFQCITNTYLKMHAKSPTIIISTELITEHNHKIIIDSTVGTLRGMTTLYRWVLSANILDVGTIY